MTTLRTKGPAMTRDDIIRMAREAECEETWGADAFRFGEVELERFFKLAYDAGRKAALAEPVQEPQRKPLETKQLEQIMADCFADFADKRMPPNWWHWSLRSFARAIERAHGIGDNT